MKAPARALLVACLAATAAWAAPPDDPTQAPAPGPITPPATPPTGLWRWFDPATAPFIPVPLIGVDPDSGTTLGLIPTWVHTDENHEINRIIAPDVLYNPYFGVGVHGRVYGYSSRDEQWSVVTGIKERVEREFDAEYQRGRLREDRWSFNSSVIYDRSGVPRFYGVGNETPKSAETNYTNQQERAQLQVGLNLSHEWQLLYTARLQVVDVLPGTLTKVASIQTRFALWTRAMRSFVTRSGSVATSTAEKVFAKVVSNSFACKNRSRWPTLTICGSVSSLWSRKLPQAGFGITSWSW